MASPDPAIRHQAARVAAYSLHSQRDSREITAKARATFLSRFATQVDPERRLSERERLRRATAAKRAYFARLSLQSARRRRQRRDGNGQG